MKRERMTRSLCALALILFAGSAFRAAAAAQAAAGEAKPQVRLALSFAQVDVGDTFEAAIWLQGFTGDYSDIQGYEIRIDYDPELLEPVTDGNESALKPKVFAGGASPMTLANRIDTAAGSIHISQVTTKKGNLLFAGYGKAGELRFKALKAGEAQLTQSKSIVIKADNPGVNIIHTVNAPTVVIGTSGSVSGGSEQTDTVGEEPEKKGGSVTKDQALRVFRDYGQIASMSWAADAIASFSRSKVMQGTPAGNFEPRKNITRAEFAKTAVVALGLDMTQRLTPTFADVPKTAWHYDYVETAAEYGLVEGSTRGGRAVFLPNEPITRAEIAAVVSRFLRGFEGFPGTAAAVDIPFADVSADHWAYEDIRYLHQFELLKGKSADRFAPADNASRAEAAVLLERLLALRDG